MYTRNNDDDIIDVAIAISKYKRTDISKNDSTNVSWVTIDADHTVTDKTKTTLLQRGRNMGQASSTVAQRLLHSINCDSKHVQFKRKPTIATFHDREEATMLTYDHRADGHYLRKKDRKN